MMKLALLFFLFSLSTRVLANDLQLGISVGPSWVKNTDFNGQNTKIGLHLTAGLGILFPLHCQAGFCRGLFLEPGIAFTFPATTGFGATRVASTGVVGNYSESLKIYSGNINFKKHLRAGRRLTLFALGGIGINYFQVSDHHFTDALGVDQSLSVSESSLNPSLNLGLGLAYEAGKRVLISASVVPHIVFTAIKDQSYLMLPLGMSYAF